MMKPYEYYKGTDISWLDKVPSHWHVRKISELFTERRTKVSDKDYPPLSVSKNGIVPQLSNAAKSNDGDNRKLVCSGDFVINSRSDRKGSSGMSTLTGSVSLINIALEPRQQNNRRFMHYLLKSSDFIEEYYRNGRGIVADLWTTRYSEMKTIMLAIPIQEEQEQIARYLDWQTSRINTFVQAKRCQIELLKEQKQAIINKAVTKGLDDTVAMKDSGVEWLGDVPAHWRIRPFRKIAVVKSNLVNPKDFMDERQVSPADIEKSTGRLLHCGTVRDAGVISDNHQFYKGQILYSKIRPLLNKVTIAPFDGLCSADMYPIETTLETKYLMYFMLSHAYLSQISMSGNRVKMPKINKDELANILILFSNAEEQQAIVTYLEEKIALIDKSIVVIEKEIELVSEYKTSLISSVVTGKVDVREIIVPEFDAALNDALESDAQLEVNLDDSY